MQRIVCFVALLVAVVLAQSPQPGPFNPVNLVSGVTVSGSLLPTSPAANYHVDLYTFFVPENAAIVQLSLTNLNEDNCGEIYLYASTFDFPCSYHDYDDESYACANPQNIYDGIPFTYTQEYYDGLGSDENWEWQVNKDWYFAVGRESLEETFTCGYEITATVNMSCTVGTLGSSDTPTCSVPYQTVTLPYASNFSYNGVATFNSLYKINVPVNTGVVQVRAVANTPDIEITGYSYGFPSGESYNCYEDEYDTENDTVYYYTLNCYTPRSGNFYIAFTSSETFNGSFIITQTVCPAGFGGYNCQFASLPINTTSPNVVTIAYPVGGNYLSSPFAYFYFDIVANFTSPDVYLDVSVAGTSDVEVYLRRDGYPEEDSTWGYDYDFQDHDIDEGQFALNQFDWQVPGRMFLGIQCLTDLAGCVVTVFTNSSLSTGLVSTNAITTQAVTTQGVTTGGITTKGITTGSISTGAITTGAVTTKSITTKTVTSGSVTTNTVTTSVKNTTGSVTTSQHTSAAHMVVIPSFVAIVAALLFFL